MSHHVDKIVPQGVHSPAGAYSHLVRSHGDILWLAGQVGMDEHGNLVGEGDVAAQFEQIVRNMEKVLTAAGAGWGDVVRVLFLCVGKQNVQALREARTRVWSRLYPDGAFPAATFVLVEGLALDELLVEVEATAIVPD
jgi:enamine deaminase RidA (YjgF/YER057c/UK114 family)